MAKKSSSATKKVVKKPAASKTKTVVKKPVKPTAKPVKKAAAKPAKPAPAKAVKKPAPKVAPVEKKKMPLVKEVAKAKPAMLSKKAVEPETEVAAVEETAASDDGGSQKAEKISKLKPIRVEKGNAADEKAKWAELNKKYGKDKAVNYKMSDTFTSLTPIQHKVLGWGFILSSDNDRLEVLFETGIRMLISNYKS
jgi:hypothetical protein